MNILYAYADNKDEWNCSEFRVMMPLREINKLSKHLAQAVYIGDLVTGEPGAMAKAKNSDIIIYQRNMLFRAMASMECWKAEGKAVAIDIDDGYHYMPPTFASYDFWINGILRGDGKTFTFTHTPLKQLEWACQLADAVISPSRVILSDWDGKYARKTIFVNNYLEDGMYLSGRTLKPNRIDTLIIGWGGSGTHRQSFFESGFITAIRRVMEKRKHVKLMIAGSPYDLRQKMRLPDGRFLIHPWVPHNQWANTLRLFDIGIAPLAGQYDRRRSWLKGAEYSYLGIPWIASDYEPYQSLRDYGVLVRNKPQEWEDALIDMIDNYTEYAINAHRKIAEAEEIISMTKNVGKIIEAYEEVLDNRQ